MTCIVGVRHKKGVTLGGDSLGVAGLQATPRADGKVFKLSPEIAVGFTSSYRMGQILRFHVQPPEIKGDEYEWAVRDFVPVIRKAFGDHGYKKVSDGVEQGGTFLLAVRRRLFEVESDFQVGESICDFHAVGCGNHLALGAFHALPHSLPPRERAKRALQAAEAFSAGVAAPFTFVETRA